MPIRTLMALLGKTLAAGLVFTLIFTSCRGTMADLCGQQITRFEAQVTTARDTFALRVAPDRTPASVTLKLTDEESAEWQIWAEDRLKEAQKAIDIVMAQGGNMKAARQAFSMVADQSVTVHGYAQQKDSIKLAKALVIMSAKTQKARELACESGPSSLPSPSPSPAQ